MKKALAAGSVVVFGLVAALGLQRHAVAQVKPAPGITRIAITDRHPAFGGTSFGAPGPYEFVSGTAYGEFDPKAPMNAAVVDLQYAPRNADGRVAYSMDFTILKPVDETKGNGRLIYDVMNRGHEKALWTLNLSKLDPNCVTSLSAAEPQCLGTEPADVTEPGTAFIMKRGYTVVWSGWQAEHSAGMASRPGLLKANFPIAIDRRQADHRPEPRRVLERSARPVVHAVCSRIRRRIAGSVRRQPHRARTGGRSASSRCRRSSWSYVDATHVQIDCRTRASTAKRSTSSSIPRPNR